MPSTRADRSSRGGGNNSFEDFPAIIRSLASKPFLFVVGEEHKEFHIHKELIGQLSPALNALVNGQMKEAREGRVEWPDLEVETFVRFAKYAYSRDYCEAEPELLPRPPPPMSPLSPPSLTQQQGSQSSQTQMIDLTDQTDNDGSDAEDDDQDDEQNSSSVEDESSDSLMEDDDEEELEDDDDDDEEEMYDEEEEDDDMGGNANAQGGEFGRHQIQESIRATTKRTPWVPKDLPPKDFKVLPYSIHTYIDDWETHVRSLFFAMASPLGDDTTANQPPAKRRMIHNSESRFTSSANLKYNAMQRFRKLPFDVENDHWHPRLNESAYENFEPVFMSHVRLYALAEKYGVEQLKALTLHRLHLALTSFQIFPERVGDVACIVPVIYDYTVPDDMARKMIVLFFCCVAEHVKENPDFRAALRNVGEFADDLFQEMANRLQ